MKCRDGIWPTNEGASLRSLESPTRAACVDACVQDTNCSAVAYRQGEGQCHLKTNFLSATATWAEAKGKDYDFCYKTPAGESGFVHNAVPRPLDSLLLSPLTQTSLRRRRIILIAGLAGPVCADRADSGLMGMPCTVITAAQCAYAGSKAILADNCPEHCGLCTQGPRLGCHGFTVDSWTAELNVTRCVNFNNIIVFGIFWYTLTISVYINHSGP